MCTLMDMLNVTLITLAWELHQQGVPKAHIAERLGKHRETVHLWIREIEDAGLLPFLDRYQQAKKGPRTEAAGGPCGEALGLGPSASGRCSSPATTTTGLT